MTDRVPLRGTCATRLLDATARYRRPSPTWPTASETRFYHVRHRAFDPRQGRFITRDPLGLWADPGNWGNPYAYAANAPWTFTDPLMLLGRRGPSCPPWPRDILRRGKASLVAQGQGRAWSPFHGGPPRPRHLPRDGATFPEGEMYLL